MFLNAWERALDSIVDLSSVGQLTAHLHLRHHRVKPNLDCICVFVLHAPASPTLCRFAPGVNMTSYNCTGSVCALRVVIVQFSVFMCKPPVL